MISVWKENLSITWLTLLVCLSIKRIIARSASSLRKSLSFNFLNPCGVFPKCKVCRFISIISRLGAINAVEQNDVDTLRSILSKKFFPIDICLENGLYAYFTHKFTLLDAALMLNRSRVAELLLQNKFKINPELAQREQRSETIAKAIQEVEKRLNDLNGEVRNKDDEKRTRVLTTQFSTLKQMQDFLQHQHLIPEKLENVTVEVSGSNRATIGFDCAIAQICSRQNAAGEETLEGRCQCIIVSYLVSYAYSFDRI